MNVDTIISAVRQIGPFTAVVLSHLMFFHALQSGLPREVARLLQKEIVVVLITPEPAQAPKRQAASMPEPAPRRKQAAPVLAPAPDVQAPSPITTALAVPRAAPALAEPAAASALPAAPVAGAAAIQPKTISSGVEYLQAPKPDYPAQSRRIGETGNVLMRVLVNDAGRPQRADVQDSSGSPRLDEAARTAVMRALFKPHLEDGKAVAVYVLVPINFQLNG